MQDAVEMSFATAKRAHSIILQEIEKGNCDWDNLDREIYLWVSRKVLIVQIRF